MYLAWAQLISCGARCCAAMPCRTTQQLAAGFCSATSAHLWACPALQSSPNEKGQCKCTATCSRGVWHCCNGPASCGLQ